MQAQNPYSAPTVEQTAYSSADEVLFEFRRSSRNLLSIVASLPLLFAAVVIVVQVVSGWEQISSNAELLTAASIATLLFSAFLTYVFYGLVWPRIYEFRVDREFVSWQSPWPNSSEGRIPISTIERVEFHGAAVAMFTSSGDRYCPPKQSYGGESDEVVEAITLAVSKREPQTIAAKTVHVESLSLMRRFGRLVGKGLRFLSVRK